MFIVDSDVFITAKNRYYSFGVCPGFWDSVIDHHQKGSVHSLDHVRQELLRGRDDDDLVQWVKTTVPDAFFLSSRSDEVVATYTDVMLWVQRHPNYFDTAKAEFAAGADGWLVAYAKVHEIEVVTNEQPRPDSRSKVKLPDVCLEFGVAYRDTFAMLEVLHVQFDYSPRT